MQHVGHSSLLRGVRILVVEDDPEALELLGNLLEAFGATTSGASSCGEALDAFDRFVPDVVVSDINLAGPRNGVDLVCELRRRGLQAPVIAVSSEPVPDHRPVPAFEAFFRKPFSSVVLAEEIARIVKSVRSAEQLT
jgi:CheY-like chemotaxis protein